MGVSQYESRPAGLAVKDTEDFYRALFEHSADAILVIEDERFVDCNPAAVRMLRFPDKQSLLERYSGGTREGTFRAHPGEFSPPTQPDGRDSFEKADEIMGIAFERGSQTFEWDHVRADGEVFPVEVQLTPIKSGDRQVLLVHWREIGERKRMEAELQRAQRLEAVGRLAGGIAHDFNNLLVVIVSYAELLGQDLMAAGLSEAAGHAGEIEAAADRAAELTHQLLSFSRGQPIQPRPTDLVALLEDCGTMLRRLIGEDIEFVLELPDAPVVVRVDPSQIERMIVNLVTNARDAMSNGGGLHVHLESSLDRRPDSRNEPPMGPQASITVSDCGEGMTAEQIDHAFEPFYTTKQGGAGTGLGLATVRSIADQCGGRTSIESTPQQGTSVTVTIPLSTEAPARKRDADATVPAVTGDELVLVVEDEAAIRRLIERTLVRHGYQVLTASDGSEALEVANSVNARIDLVISDVIMPHLSGPKLIEQLRKSRPDVSVIFMSGYAHEGSLYGDTLESNAEILEKPFSQAVLLTLLRRVLDRK
jgi:signal transduction histidine kinase/CheY-like chemotaxis protein